MDDVSAVLDAVEELKKQVAELHLPGEMEAEEIDGVTSSLKELVAQAREQYSMPSEDDIERVDRMTEALEKMQAQAVKTAAALEAVAEAAEEVEPMSRG